MNWIRPQVPRLLTLAFFVGLLAPATANNEFADDYMLYWQENIDGDEALELGELQQAMAHYQQAMDQLEALIRRYPGQDVDLVLAKRAEVRKKIHDLRLQGVNPVPQNIPVPPPPGHNQQALPGNLQQELERQQQLLRQEKMRVQDLQRRLRDQQAEHLRQMTQEQERRKLVQAEVLRIRDQAKQARVEGQEAATLLRGRINELETQLDGLNGQLLKANQLNQELAAALSNAQTRIAELETSEQGLLAEKAQLEERLRVAGTQEGFELLVQDNQRLKNDFQQLQQQYDALKEQAEIDSHQAVELKLQVADLEKQVKLYSVENEELEQRLKRTETRLATAIEERDAAGSTIDPATAEGEIRILRAELARQKGDHAHRQLIRQAILSELEKLSEGGAEIRQFLDQMVAQDLDADQRRQQLVERMLNGTIVSDAAPRAGASSLVLSAEEAKAIEDLSQTAKKQFADGNFERALHNYDTILQSVPNDVPTLIRRGVVLLRAGRSGDAEASLKKALAQRPKDSYARTMLALALLEQDRTERAIEEVELAIEFNPTDASAHFYRGLIAHREMDFALAESQYLEAVTLQPEFATAHFNLASLLSKMNPVDRERIRHHYMEAVKYDAPRDLQIENVINNA